MRPALLCSALLAAACTHSAPRSQVDALCHLTSAPHASAAERSALRHRAQGAFSALKPFAGTPRNKAITKAVLEITVSGVDLPSDIPTPLATAFTQNGTPFGLRSLDDALNDLARACLL